ncbi:hypothetical protein LXD69_10230 [Flavobacterium sediminilitoris]|uniref:Uncharacterized protein n=1 Tax=Flavobacterium sediminilitoris TaxID=2024526 RepID=A0ABY4HHW0_9FLAO|nr:MULTISPECIES: hypothetical protein [Flavobacterium]UOX32429.1 hypothetical protein LXD69_10230 [Flavobacterium sediminilitoris]
MDEIIKKYQEAIFFKDLTKKNITLNRLKFELMDLIFENKLSKKEVAISKEILQNITVTLSSELLVEIKEKVFFVRTFSEVNKSLDLMYNVTLRSDWCEDNETRNKLIDAYESLKTLLQFTNDATTL